MANYKASSYRAASIVGPSLLLLLALTAVVCSASPVISASDSLRVKRQAGETTTTESTTTGAETAVGLKPCNFKGNADVYGLGIRVGLYAQWLSTYISNWLHKTKVTKMRDINTCFQLAMLIALMAMANQNPAPHAIDPLIIIIQFIGSASTITNKATHKSEWKGTSWGGMIRFFVYWAVSIYAIWFWWIGLESFEPPEVQNSAPPESYIIIGFAFSKQDIMTGWFRTANKAASCVFGLVYTILFAYSAYMFGPEYVRNGRSKISTVYHRIPRNAPAQQAKNDDIQVDKIMEEFDARLNKWTPTLCIVLLFTAATSVECIIIWNRITDVDDMFSTGQLIPLVVGVGGLIQVLYKLTNQDVRVPLIHRNRAPAGQRPLK